MNLIRTCLLSFFLCVAFLANGQFHHFPQNYEVTYAGVSLNQWPSIDTVYSFHKCKYDSSYSDSFQVPFTFPVKRMKITYLASLSFDWCSSQKPIPENRRFQMEFLEDSLFMGTLIDGTVGLIFPKNIELGDTFQVISELTGIDSMVYFKDTMYVMNDIQDTGAVLRLIDNGQLDTNYQCPILGKNLGWLRFGFLEHSDNSRFQYCKVINGESTHQPTHNWKLYYPEREGDYKIWKTDFFKIDTWPLNEADLSDSVIAMIDSFLNVQEFNDSIVGTKIRRYQRMNLSWTANDTISFTHRSDGIVPQYFTNKNFGNQVLYYNWNQDTAVLYYTHHVINSNPAPAFNIWTYLKIRGGNYKVNSDPCLNEVLPFVEYNDTYYESVGFVSRDLEFPNLGVSKGCVAYSVGNIKFGEYTILGEKSIEKRRINIYPNPSSNALFIDVDFEAVSYSIFNSQGKQVDSGTLRHGSLSVSHLKDGIYFLQLSNGNQVYRTKIQVQH